QVIDVILTGMHEPGERHFELLRAFADDRLLNCMIGTAKEHDYGTHEFDDSLLD
ncbi:MAG: S-adenosylmethionine tRNA ribosyltransferase, partial [Rhodospirillales bacterium]|nr:S-adenosylmethionine tRNA ribosyltransferase [Rhodospirillales bacterium]